MECEFCKSILKTANILKYHQTNSKKCLEIQANCNTNIKSSLLKCNFCKKDFSSLSITRHYSTCKYKSQKERDDIMQQEIEKVKSENQKEIENCLIEKEKIIIEILSDNKNYKEQIKKLEEQNRELQHTIEKMGLKAIERPTNNTIELEIDTDEEIDNEYKLTPLEIENGLIIENREEDGYINITNLCKAGNKQFKHWKESEKSKAYLQALSSQVGIPTSDLIKLGSGSIHKKSHTWVHPQVAINIAQWISPYFDVKVSAWVYEIYLTGKVDISNTKTYHELKEENKNKELKITFLTNKYVKKQKRKDFKNDNNVIYILTTENLKKERIYIFGKAKKLKNRISTYNKSEEHEVVYYKECKNEQIMSCVENMVFNKLSEYRQQANRERFFLPINKEIDYFIDIVDRSVKFLS